MKPIQSMDDSSLKCIKIILVFSISSFPIFHQEFNDVFGTELRWTKVKREIELFINNGKISFSEAD